MSNDNTNNEARIGLSLLNAELEDGFYMLTGPNGEEPCLVRLYTPKEPPYRGIGFGVWDGGAFMPLSDLRDDSKLNPVKIIESSNGQIKAGGALPDQET